MTDKVRNVEQEEPNRGPNCWQCRHLMITWDVRTPYGCRMMGFRSKYIPSLEVLRTDGRFCGGFAPKVSPKASKPTLQSVDKPSGSNKSKRLIAIQSVNIII